MGWYNDFWLPLEKLDNFVFCRDYNTLTLFRILQERSWTEHAEGVALLKHVTTTVHVPAFRITNLTPSPINRTSPIHHPGMHWEAL